MDLLLYYLSPLKKLLSPLMTIIMPKKSTFNTRLESDKKSLADLLITVVEEIRTIISVIGGIRGDKKSLADLHVVVASIYRVSAALKKRATLNIRKMGGGGGGGRVLTDSHAVVASIYRISATLKDLKVYTGDPMPSDNLLIILDYLEGLKRVLRSDYFASHRKEIIKGLENTSSSGQLKSKAWLIDVLKEKNILQLGNVFFCAGWYGILPYILLHDKAFFINQLFNFEKDPLSVRVSEDLNRKFVKDGWKFKASLKDILELNYRQAQFNTLKASGEIQALTVSPDTIINTSCEHIDPFSKWWNKLPKEKLIILQSNDFFHHKEHINCVSSIKEFKKQAPLNLLYEGELDLGQYKRFMLIGHKK